MSTSDDYVDVPGDCIHFPGYENARAGCLLCNPRPAQPSDQPPDHLRLREGLPVAPHQRYDGWAHTDCVDGRDARIVEASYLTQCPICLDNIHPGDDISPATINH